MVNLSTMAFAMMPLMLTFSESFHIRKFRHQRDTVFNLNMVTAIRPHSSVTESSIEISADVSSADLNLREIGDFTGPEKPQQLTQTNLKLLISTTDIMEFTSLLKQMAAKRRRIPDSDRPALSRAILERLDQLSDELFSDCVWSIGTLRCTLIDISSVSSTTDGTDPTTSFWNKVARVSETANRLCLTRLAIGLGKMGLRWDNLPDLTRVGLIKLIQNEKLAGDANFQQKTIPDSRELATILFTLGQLGVTTDILPEGSLSRVLEEVAQIAVKFTPQGLSNALHGLARMGVLWSDLPMEAQSALPSRGATIVAEMRPDELCSIVQSMAVMKVQWATLPSAYKSELLTALEATLPTLNNRELSNVFWALGKTNINYNEHLSASFRETLTNCLVGDAGDMKLFDLESIFVGLGLMQVDFDALSDATREYLLRCVERNLSNMNIFCTYNVLWGLARMGASVSSMGPSLSFSVLDKAVNVLHTFLPTQYGDVIWSLGSLGYSKSDLSPVMSDRLLAVLSRVYGKLHVRAAAYTLWGLSKMGFQWDDMRSRTRSLAGGREADPLSDSVSKYLRQRVASMKEHEYSVLLYSLGGLRVQLQGSPEHTLPSYVTDKIHHRATRVSAFLTSRSLANSLYGLGKCGVRWMSLPVETRDAWQDAMLRTTSPPGPALAVNARGRETATERRGLAGMRTVELAQTLFGLGQLQVPWKSLSLEARTAILREVEQPSTVSSMDPHSLSSGLWGLSAMGCPLQDLPPTLLATVRSRLWSSTIIANNAASTEIAEQRSELIPDLQVVSDGEMNPRSASGKIGFITAEEYREINRESETRPVSKRGVLTAFEEAGLSLSMGIEAIGRLGAALSAEELSTVSLHLQVLAPHMGPDSIVSCASGLSQLGAQWTDLSLDTRVSWLATLRSSLGELSKSKKEDLAVHLTKLKAF